TAGTGVSARTRAPRGRGPGLRMAVAPRALRAAAAPARRAAPPAAPRPGRGRRFGGRRPTGRGSARRGERMPRSAIRSSGGQRVDGLVAFDELVNQDQAALLVDPDDVAVGGQGTPGLGDGTP